jgi:lysophospholipase L1-like esterase
MERLLALGDSYTIGEGVPPAGRWPVQLAQILREEGVELADPEIIARTGWTTAELIDGIARARPAGPYALVSLLIGVNNQYRGRDLAEYRSELQMLLRQAIAFAGGNPARVLVVSIPDWGVTPFAAGRGPARIAREIDAFNDAKRGLAGAAGVPFADVTPLSRAAGHEPGMLADDGLHPSAAMYRMWARAILPLARIALQNPRT